MKYITYVLHNETNNKIYIGHTSDLDKRLKRHNGHLISKKKSFTRRNRSGGTWNVVHQETFHSRLQAKVREKQLKSYQGRKYIRDKILGP